MNEQLQVATDVPVPPAGAGALRAGAGGDPRRRAAGDHAAGAAFDHCPYRAPDHEARWQWQMEWIRLENEAWRGRRPPP